jgi:arsenite methyltransferase
MDEEAVRETARQLARPTGEGGLKITTAMNESNAFITARALEVLSLEVGEALVEIGPGNAGLSREAVAGLGGEGTYLGFEYNEDIAAVARETLVECETPVEVRSGDFMDHAPEAATFDALMAVNVVYFFEDLDAFVGRCCEWLRPGGRAAIGLRSLQAMTALPISKHGFHLRSLDELLRALHRAGFNSVQARYFNEGTTNLGDLTISVDSIIVSATRA